MIHPTAEIETNDIGENTKIWRWTHISKGAKIGKNCMIGAGVYIGLNVVIGDNVRIQNNVFIPEGVYIRENVFIGPNCVFTNDRYPNIRNRPKYHTGTEKGWLEITIIEPEATLGANVTILPDLKIGKGSMVGAGSVVTRDVKPFTTVYGNPASEHYWKNLFRKLTCHR